MTRVIHTGDTHIGYRQYHSPDRQADFFAAFEQVIDDAIDLDVDAIVHAGDLFHNTRPAIPDLMQTVSALRRLARADIPFLGIVGNHEATSDRQWLDLFSDLDLAIRLDSDGYELHDVTLYGLDYVPPTQRERIDYDFATPDTTYTALVAHGLFEPFAHADWDTAALLDAATVAFDALLLADNHSPGQTEIADTWITYCGSTERASAAEREHRGYNLVTFDDGVRITRRQLTGIREWVFVDVTLAGTEGTEHVITEATAYDVADAVVIVRVSGDGSDISPATIEEQLDDSGALLTRVIDERALPDRDIHQVSFADPDRAVRERLRSTSISEAGSLIDAVVRDKNIPDSGVRDRIETRIETLLHERPEAFERRSDSAAADTDAETDEPRMDVDSDQSNDNPDNNGDGQRSIAEFG